MLENRTKGRVFLSYGHDKACTGLVYRIKADLEARGWEPWVDTRRIDFGDDWRREITKGIRESQHVLAFLSKYSTRKPGVCRQEVAIALGPLRGHVYTVLVEPLSEVTPPLILSRLQWLDMQQWQTLKDSNPAEYESMYGQCLEQILRVLERNQPFAGEIDELYRWLQPLDGTADMVDAENGFTGREWLLGGIGNIPGDAEPPDSAPSEVGEIEAWRTAGSSNRVFWLAAQPGWGKSSVAARLAHVGRTKVLAVHFCKHDRPNTRDARQVVRTLAFQMATQLGDYRQLLLAEAARNTALGEMNAQELFHALLANPLTHELQGTDNTRDLHLVVLDALDETLDERGRSDLLNLVATDFQRLPAWIGLVVTSRPEAPIVRQLGKFGVHQLAAEDPRNLEDLRKYVAAWLESLGPKVKSVDKALGAVMDASAGNFLYVRQLREAVAEGVLSTDSLLEAGQLPRGLSSLYEQWFLSRFPSADYYDEKLRPLLELMLAAREPLPRALVAAVLQWDAYGPRALEKLGTLCVVENGTARLFHKSLSDWLEDPEVCGWEFHADPKEGHKRLAHRLWDAYLKSCANSKIASDGQEWGNLDSASAEYALMHLPTHLNLASRSEDARHILQDFAFAMQRCAADGLEAMLGDYRLFRLAPQTDPLAAWADCILGKAHFLRRAEPAWPAHKILLQVAVEHAEDSPVTRAAEEWLEKGGCDWVWVWDTQRVKHLELSPLISVLEGHTGAVRGVRRVAEGQLATWSDDGSMRLWDIDTGTQILIVEDFGISTDDWAETLARSEAPSPLVLGVRNEFAKLIDASSGKVLHCSIIPHVKKSEISVLSTVGVSDAFVRKMEKSENERSVDFAVSAKWLGADRFAIFTDQAAIYLFSAVSGEFERALLGHKNKILGSELLTDGRLMTWSRDKTVRIWSVDGSDQHLVFAGHKNAVRGAKAIANDRAFSWAGAIIYLWEMKSGNLIAKIEDHSNEVNGIIAVPEGFISYSTDGSVRFRSPDSLETLAVIESPNKISGVVELDEGKVIIFGAYTIPKIWNYISGQESVAVAGHENPILSVVRLYNGDIACWAMEEKISIFSPADVSSKVLLAGHVSDVLGVAGVPGGYIVSWDGRGQVRYWTSPAKFSAPLIAAQSQDVKAVISSGNDAAVSVAQDNRDVTELQTEEEVSSPSSGETLYEQTDYFAILDESERLVPIEENLSASLALEGRSVVRYWKIADDRAVTVLPEKISLWCVSTQKMLGEVRGNFTGHRKLWTILGKRWVLLFPTTVDGATVFAMDMDGRAFPISGSEGLFGIRVAQIYEVSSGAIVFEESEDRGYLIDLKLFCVAKKFLAGWVGRLSMPPEFNSIPRAGGAWRFGDVWIESAGTYVGFAPADGAWVAQWHSEREQRYHWSGSYRNGESPRRSDGLIIFSDGIYSPRSRALRIMSGGHEYDLST